MGWDIKRIPETALTVLVGIWLLFAAYGRHAYGYYTLLRIAVTVGSFYWAVLLYRRGSKGLPWAFVAVVILLNPVVPIRMHRADWQPIDFWLGLSLLGWSTYWFIRRTK